MKRLVCFCLMLVLCAGCASEQSGLDRAMSFRSLLFNSQGCEFVANIYADYGDVVYAFELACVSDDQGGLRFTVIRPESIADICGEISATGGSITFEDTVLAFPLLADEQITPVSAPWVMLRSLRGGYIRAAEEIENGLHICLDDSYQEDPLELEVYLDSDHRITAGEILWRGKRILSMEIMDFHIL